MTVPPNTVASLSIWGTVWLSSKLNRRAHFIIGAALVAILGALLEENDADSRLATEEFAIPGEYTDMEISRRSIHSSVSPTSTPAGSTDPEHTRAIQTGP